MEREISTAVELGVGMIAIAALITIIWFTVFLGKDMANGISMESSNMISTIEVGKLEELRDLKDPIPAAAVESILRANERFIVEVNRGPNVKKMEGMVNLEVIYSDDLNGYIMNITEAN